MNVNCLKIRKPLKGYINGFSNPNQCCEYQYDRLVIKPMYRSMSLKTSSNQVPYGSD